MCDLATVMIVEDDEIMRMLYENALGTRYRVISVATGEGCLASSGGMHVDIILLDVELPGISGYETCRLLKARDGESPPVIFISSRDRLEDRLQGYDAGGEDYILKPVAPEELLTKVELRLRAAEDRVCLKQQAAYASTTAMTAMSSMGEMGVLQQAQQRFNASTNCDDLACALVQALNDYSLNGVVLLRTHQGKAIHSTQGAASPIEISVIEQVAAMGRIVEYRSRMSVSYEHVALMVTNTPLDNDERRGRLRDHLAALVEAAELRATSIGRDNLIEQTAIRASQVLASIDKSQREMLVATNLALQEMCIRLERAYVSAALSESQERHMAQIVDFGIESVRRILEAGTDVQQQVSDIVSELKRATAS